jgi:hypothetical protein
MHKAKKTNKVPKAIMVFFPDLQSAKAESKRHIQSELIHLPADSRSNRQTIAPVQSCFRSGGCFFLLFLDNSFSFNE